MIEPITTVIALLSLGGKAISTIYGVFSDGVPGGVTGNEAHNLVKENIRQLKENLNRHRPYLNHDLQRAIRLAYLQATLQVCAIRLQEHGVDETKLKTFLRRRFPMWLKRKEPLGIFAQGEVEWLDKVCVWIEEEIRKLKTEDIPPLTVEEKDLGFLMQPTDAPIAQLKSLRGQMIAKVVDELKAEHGKLPDKFYSLMTKGWTQVNQDGTDLKQDWFDLFCLSFQHEAKKKNDIRIDFQNKILAGLTFQNGNAITFDQITHALAQSNAELAKKLDEATKLLQEKFDAGFEKLDERFDELAPVLALAVDIPSQFDSLADLIRAESQRVIDENRAEHERTRAKIDELKGRVIQENPVDVILANFNIDAAVYGREDEREEILKALRGEWRDEKGVLSKNKVWLLSAGSSFGKTYLAIKVLQEVIDSETRKIKDPNVNKVAVLECRGAELTDFIGALGDLVGLRQTLKSWFAELSDKDKQDETKLRRWLNENLFIHLESAGTVWLLFDNFEALLTEDDYRIKDAGVRVFIELLAANPRNFRVLILTQSVPQFRGAVLTQLKAGEKLRKGLDERAALEYLKNELPDESDDLLKRFAAKVFYLPMPMNTVTGYLKTTGRGLKEVLDEKSDGFRYFENREIEEGTKFFIRRQIEAQPDGMKRLLCALTFFAKPLPIEALEPLLGNKSQDPRETIKRLETHNLAEKTTGLLKRLLCALTFLAEPLSIKALEPLLDDEKAQDPRETIRRLETHNLAEVTTGLRKTVRYDLHTYFRKETESTLLPQNLSLFDEAYYEKLIESGNKAGDFTYHKRAQDLYECAEQICNLFLGKDKSNQSWCNNLAAAYMNKGIALADLNRLNEAIDAYDPAIEICERLVNVENQTQFENGLAAVYLNKGAALRGLNKLSEAIETYDLAIKIRKRLVKEENQIRFENDLAAAYVNKGVALRSLNKLNEAIETYDLAIEIFERLVNVENQTQFKNDLAAAYGNKGVALRSLNKLNEAIEEHDKAIEIRERLVNVENQTQFENDLAGAYVNKGAVLADLNKLNEAIAAYDLAIEIFGRLVNEENQTQLENNLAAVYMNKGIAFRLSDLYEAIEIRERLANVENQTQLANDLAAAYENKAVVLEQKEDWDAALICFENALQLWSVCVEKRGMYWLMPDLLQLLRYRLMTLLDLKRWQEAAQDVSRFLALYTPFVADAEIHDGLKGRATEERDAMIDSLRRLSEEERELVYAELSADEAETVRELVKG